MYLLEINMYCSLINSYALFNGGDKGNRTLDPLRARQMLSHLSYIPKNVYLLEINMYCSLINSYALFNGGDKGNRTLDPLRARQMLSHLSYIPKNVSVHDTNRKTLAESEGFEPSRLLHPRP